ncbi:hypothetical protein [Deinococcus wulumuqiensis]|uniref:Uncharacterized protein n=1 Tax=Deinococcus wulumuqiensis TaxID=980427 RepID=A0AAV4K6J7_9DEIO|nr:hypothetical protein [Deinococcus wulumuqiensis]QII21507.1 hypothetical protein G6R31_12845 [Deinococcus wulumuqiensis R12]GGI90088.1 hypothetical protein GCM10010914_25670 [Deinococcus wulumuqiensis]GGP30681.1 hypothetical protein GCM10008021_23320 [Deinococcus wulumuqiensis]
MTDAKRDTVPPIAAELSVHADEHAVPSEVVAEQGPPPADYAQRPASGVDVTPGEGLSAEQVVTMTGGDAEAADANVELQEAQGLDTGAHG